GWRGRPAGRARVGHGALSCLLSQDAADDADEVPPLLPPLGQPSRPFFREVVYAPAGAAPVARAVLPGAGDQARLLQPVEGGVEGAFLQPEGTAAGLLEPPQDLEAVGLAPLQGREAHPLQVAPEAIAADEFHPYYLDRLNSAVKWNLRRRRNRAARRSRRRSSPLRE